MTRQGRSRRSKNRQQAAVGIIAAIFVPANVMTAMLLIWDVALIWVAASQMLPSIV